jgi:spore coat polysaccharide biosynthesis protein SpsF
MKEILGVPMIGHIVNSLTFCKKIDEVIIVTSTNHEDDILVNYLKKNNLKYFRGSENDVLLRFVNTLKKYPADYVVRLTADNPLIDPQIVDLVVETAIKTNSDYASNHQIKSFPLGYVVEVVRSKTLIEIEKLTQNLEDREHVTWYIYRNLKKFKTSNLTAPKNLNHPNWRLTVDTEEDFTLIKKIYDLLYKKNKFIKYSEVVNLILKKPELLDINKNVKQKIPNQGKD